MRRVFLFDYDKENESNQYTKTWNAYFGKSANGNVPTDFPQANSRILASLKGTVASRVSKDRELRMLVKERFHITPSHNHEHVSKIPPNSKSFFLENNLHAIKMWFSEKMITQIALFTSLVDAFIDLKHTVWKSWFCQINHIQDLVDAFIDQMHTVRKSLSENLFNMTNHHLVNTSCLHHIQPFADAFIDQMHVTQK